MEDVHGKDLRWLLGLDKYEINYISKAGAATFTKGHIKKELRKNWKVYYDSVLAHHYPIGQRINYYLGQFYASFTASAFQMAVDNGYPAKKVVIGMMSGQFSKDNFSEALTEIGLIYKKSGKNTNLETVI